ncbi:hypothetical protein LUW76_38155 [Actinomadura madurae]|uniref:SCO2583/SCO2584 N-terminal domain-containing protein n=1 Tax=Actinomadura madurae TaxID=1993 RepID=UPI0020273BA4|nr:hypothetical protein [Actinomadura madurae]URM99678.1 hypothetical protein LUW76_38155 [Actinomadura madurae]
MAADFDDPVFDEDFVRSAVFTEPSARERARPPGRRERRRSRRAARRAAGGRFRRRRGRETSHRMAVFQLIGAVLVLLAISVALWWWNSAPRAEEPAPPVGPTITHSPAPAPAPTGPVPTGPATQAPPTGIPEI